MYFARLEKLREKAQRSVDYFSGWQMFGLLVVLVGVPLGLMFLIDYLLDTKISMTIVLVISGIIQVMCKCNDYEINKRQRAAAHEEHERQLAKLYPPYDGF